LRPAGILSLYSKAEALRWEDQNQNPVVFAFGNPTLAQNARVGHPPIGVGLLGIGGFILMIIVRSFSS
jgi:hypothetical protein